MKYLLEYSKYGGNFSPSFLKWFKDSEITNDRGFPLRVYHQTSKEGQEGILSKGFDIEKGRARMSDHEVPNGYFFKDDKNDIGVGSVDEPVQMEFYLSIQNPLVAKDRKDLVYKIMQMNNDFKDSYYKFEYQDNKFSTDFDEMMKTKRTRQSFRESKPEIDEYLERWRAWVSQEAAKLRDILTQTLKDNKYDGAIIEKDQGSFGRYTKTFIALYPNQIKSTNNVNFSDSNLVTEKKVNYHLASKEEFEEELENLSTLDLEDDQVRIPSFNEETDDYILKVYDVYIHIRNRDKLPTSGPFELFLLDIDDNVMGFIRGTKNENIISFNLIFLLDEYRGWGRGSDIYKHFLDNGFIIKSDTEITSSTFSLYTNLVEDGYKPLIFDDGCVGIVK